MTYLLEPCTCPKCGERSYFQIIMSCNSRTPSIAFHDNKCYKCGQQLDKHDVIEDEASKTYKMMYCNEENIYGLMHKILNGTYKKSEDEITIEVESKIVK